MKTQFRADGGASFWNLSRLSWKTLECGRPDYSDDPWVEWQGRTWLCKRKVESICEIAGYQIAQAMNLPLQPWVAFFQNEKADSFGSRKVVGVLVERWNQFRSEASLLVPAKKHPNTVGLALALGVFDRHEWPTWMLSENDADLRLFDLEFIGPFLHWPPQKTQLRDYLASTPQIFAYAREEANAAGIFEQFLEGLRRLTQLNFAEIVDFSGHPYGDNMKRVIVRGLEARRQKVLKILIG